VLTRCIVSPLSMCGIEKTTSATNMAATNHTSRRMGPPNGNCLKRRLLAKSAASDIEYPTPNPAFLSNASAPSGNCSLLQMACDEAG